MEPIPQEARGTLASDSRVERVLLAAPRGFCAGVEMAIKALSWMVRTFPAPVYCYHEIVHNQLVVERFTDLGVIFVDDISEVPNGMPIMLSAHGSAPAPASCPARLCGCSSRPHRHRSCAFGP